MADQTVIKFNPNGPEGEGLGFWEPYLPEDLVSGEGVQHGDKYFETKEGDLYSGVWDCTPCRLVPGPYTVDEFMIVLEGSIIIENLNGTTETYKAGDMFILPKGTPLSWVQSEYALKYFVIFESESGLEPENADILQSIRVDLSAELPAVENHDPSAYLSDVPEMHHLTVFKDVTGQMEVGIWDCTPMQRKPATLARSELMHILEGKGTITNGDGVVFEFSAGDTFLVPIGMGYQWHNTEYVKKVFCSFTPNTG